ncbi:hypothetical protein [Devosia sp. RR2S18]|uniref:hypothetical protein n=1 Tax=Devosia rhizosphaerae TaxID=3049774 RepID=UPI002541A5CB|nr:hypothetical protein [Devosia sp. RR2S18]WIJ25797.1 hypothetical protein QOV41_03270 [Devosia sp. RR2S18]
MLVHAERGIEVQKLTLRQVDGYADHFAPERDGYGETLFSELGLDALRGRLLAETLALNDELRDSRAEQTRLPARLLFGEACPGDREILRRNNGTWMEVLAPALPADLLPEPTEEVPPRWVSERTLLATPLEPQLATTLARKLEPHFPGLELVSWEFLSRGALRAGRLIERGLPHYLDHLTPISLAVLEHAGPTFRSLMPATATVPANREYVSDPITGHRWGRGKDRIDFFVLKGASEVRHWTVSVSEPPEHDVGVELTLKQTPGQSWAKLSLLSKDWPELQPIELEWDRLDPDQRTPEEVLEALERPAPIIPNRIVEDAHAAAWEDDARSPGLASVLATASKDKSIQLKPLADAIRRSKWLPQYGRSFRTISTDGHVPEGVPEEATGKLDAALATVGDAVLAVAEGRRSPFKNNTALLFTTWAFGRCPIAVQEQLVAALEQEQCGAFNPLLSAPRSKTVIIAGAGRAVEDVDLIARLISTLAQRQMSSTVLGALSSVLSRRARAPYALSSELVDDIAEKLVGVLQELKTQQSFHIKFKNTLLSFSGLLRYREVEPWALVRDRSVLADQAAQTLEQIRATLEHRQSRIPQGAKKLGIVSELIELLSGQGGDPNILRHIDELSEDGPEEF